ncbi:hypothetical protein JXA32_11605 [Candidatus Sumerlaeota bacterium]|nr:hypothetical protein [Candidatus Sumerlaeota bacterium]
MKRILRSSCVLTLMLTLMGMLLGSQSAWAMDMKEAGKQYRTAERDFMSGKAEEANKQLKEVEQAIADAKAGNDPAELMQVKLLEGRVTSLRKRIDSKLGVEAASDQPSSEDEGGDEPQTEGGTKPQAGGAGGNLPAGAQGRINAAKQAVESGLKQLEKAREVQDKLDDPSAELTFKGGIRNARRSAEQAKQQLADLEKRYSGQYPADHPDVVFAHEGIEKLERGSAELEAARDQAKGGAAADAQAAAQDSAPWIEKLQPYVAPMSHPKHDKDKYFIGGYTEDKTEMAQRMALYAQACTDYDAYEQSGVAAKATEELADIAKELKRQLDAFADECSRMANLRLDEAEQQIDHLLKRMEEEQQKGESGETPILMSKFAIETARHPLDLAKNVLGEENERVLALEKKYEQLLKTDAEMHKARVADTRMLPDKFNGDELDSLKAKAQEVLLRNYNRAKALRTTVISGDWKEENVVEWTDTSRTAVRHRITHYVSAQVAGKVDGEVKLYTIYLAKDRKSEDSWGELYGHVMFEDPMLEENVDK